MRATHRTDTVPLISDCWGIIMMSVCMSIHIYFMRTLYAMLCIHILNHHLRRVTHVHHEWKELYNYLSGPMFRYATVGLQGVCSTT